MTKAEKKIIKSKEKQNIEKKKEKCKNSETQISLLFRDKIKV